MARGKQQGQTKKKWSLTKRVRKFGFRIRMASVGGRRALSNRRAKKRTSLSAHDAIGTNKAKKDKRFSRRR